MESVQPNDTIASHMKQTAIQVAKTTGAVVTSPIAAVAAVGESTSYLAANVTGILPVGFNKVGKLFSSTRSKLKGVFSPRGSNSTAA
jgi:hypothetical protein